MSGTSSIRHVVASGSRPANARRAASSAASSSTASAPSLLTAALLLSRPPLLTRTPHLLESAYYAHSTALRSALSNPVPTQFYFKPGSLPLRRFQKAQHAADVETFGPRLAGAAPDVGDVPSEPDLVEIDRDHWEREDAARGENSLERRPEEEVYCLVQDGGRRWTFPSTAVEKGEGLDEAVKRGVTGVDGSLGGKGMDSWLVTRKPIGVFCNGENRTFFLRSHILAGEPVYEGRSEWTGHAWLTAGEVESRLRAQGDDGMWEGVRGMFGMSQLTEDYGSAE